MKEFEWKSKLIKWLKEIFPIEEMDDYVEVLVSDEPVEKLKYRFFTREFKYTISANGQYLGAVVKCRKPRAGENHRRGNDLPDGKFCQETWDKIKNSIVACELVKIEKQER